VIKFNLFISSIELLDRLIFKYFLFSLGVLQFIFSNSVKMLKRVNKNFIEFVYNKISYNYEA